MPYRDFNMQPQRKAQRQSAPSSWEALPEDNGGLNIRPPPKPFMSPSSMPGVYSAYLPNPPYNMTSAQHLQQFTSAAPAGHSVFEAALQSNMLATAANQHPAHSPYNGIIRVNPFDDSVPGPAVFAQGSYPRSDGGNNRAVPELGAVPATLLGSNGNFNSFPSRSSPCAYVNQGKMAGEAVVGIPQMHVPRVTQPQATQLRRTPALEPSHNPVRGMQPTLSPHNFHISPHPKKLEDYWREYVAACRQPLLKHVPAILPSHHGPETKREFPLQPFQVLELRWLMPRDRYAVYAYYWSLGNEFSRLYRAAPHAEMTRQWRILVEISCFLRTMESNWYSNCLRDGTLGRIMQDQLKQRSLTELGLHEFVPPPRILMIKFPGLFQVNTARSTDPTQSVSPSPYDLGPQERRGPTPRNIAQASPPLLRHLGTGTHQVPASSPNPSPLQSKANRSLLSAGVHQRSNGGPKSGPQRAKQDQHLVMTSAPLPTVIQPSVSNFEIHQTSKTASDFTSLSPPRTEATEVATAKFKYVPPLKPTKSQKETDSINSQHGSDEDQSESMTNSTAYAAAVCPSPAVTTVQAPVKSTAAIQPKAVLVEALRIPCTTKQTKRLAEEELSERSRKTLRLNNEPQNVFRALKPQRSSEIIDLTVSEQNTMAGSVAKAPPRQVSEAMNIESDVKSSAQAAEAVKSPPQLVNQAGYRAFMEQSTPETRENWKKDRMKHGGASNKKYLWMQFANSPSAQAEAERIKKTKSKKPSPRPSEGLSPESWEPNPSEESTVIAVSIDTDIHLYRRSGSGNRYKCEHQVRGESGDCRGVLPSCDHRCCKKGITEGRFRILMKRIAKEETKKQRTAVSASKSKKVIKRKKQAGRKGKCKGESAVERRKQENQALVETSEGSDDQETQPTSPVQIDEAAPSPQIEVEVDLDDEMEVLMMQEFNTALSREPEGSVSDENEDDTVIPTLDDADGNSTAPATVQPADFDQEDPEQEEDSVDEGETSATADVIKEHEEELLSSSAGEAYDEATSEGAHTPHTDCKQTEPPIEESSPEPRRAITYRNSHVVEIVETAELTFEMYL